MDTTTAANPHSAFEAQLPRPLNAVVKILLVVWEIAAQSRLVGLPVKGTVRNVTRLRPNAFPAGVEIWEFEEDSRLVTGYDEDEDDDNGANAEYRKVQRANRKLMLCGFFCLFVKKVLRQKLQGMKRFLLVL